MIEETDGRWFRVATRRDAFDVYGNELPPQPRAYKRAYKNAKSAYAKAQSISRSIRNSVIWRFLARRLQPLAMYLRSVSQMNSPRDIHPTVAVTGVFVFGFIFLLLTAATLSPSVRRNLPSGPLIAAVSQPLNDVVQPLNDVVPSIESTFGIGSDNNSDSNSDPSADPSGAVESIPAAAMVLYEGAARTCNMPWTVLAGVGKVETNHGASDAPGVHSGANYAGAEGPMQFEPATWNKYGVDADHDGKADIYNQTDAIYGAANYLCANGARNSSNIHNALYNYNHDDSYVANVLTVAAQYQSDAYVLPVTDDEASKLDFASPHHDYPADDIAMPVGTQIYAVRGGTAHVSLNDSCGNELQIDGTDGAVYTYCHASSIQVDNGATVNTGDPVLKSGGQPGAQGAGDSTGPHLHLQISMKGTFVCPQGLLDSWKEGKFATPAGAPTTGCFY